MRHEPCRRSVGIARWEAKLDAVVGQHGVDPVEDSGDQRGEEFRSSDPGSLGDKLDGGELAGPVVVALP